MQEKSLPIGWGIIRADKRPAMPVVGSGKDVAAGFFASQSPDLSRAYKLTSARIPETGHFVADIGEWLIRASAADGESMAFSFPGNDVVYTQQERVLRVPHEMDGTYRFEVAQYELTNGDSGYFIFGYEVVPQGRRDGDPWLMAHRVEWSSGGDAWGNVAVNTDSSPGSEFTWIARLSGKSIKHYVITVRQGEEIGPYPDDGTPMPVPQAA